MKPGEQHRYKAVEVTAGLPYNPSGKCLHVRPATPEKIREEASTSAARRHLRMPVETIGNRILLIRLSQLFQSDS
jgi:hypothetical protein